MKKLLSVLLILVMLLSLAPAALASEEAVVDEPESVAEEAVVEPAEEEPDDGVVDGRDVIRLARFLAGYNVTLD